MAMSTFWEFWGTQIRNYGRTTSRTKRRGAPRFEINFALGAATGRKHCDLLYEIRAEYEQKAT